MRTVSLKVHYVEDAKASFPFPSQTVQLLFRTASIDLQLLPGSGIDLDPTLASITRYGDLVDEYRVSDNAVGHLIVGKEPIDRRPEIAGQLLDAEKRGVAVVYTGSAYIRRDPANNFVQTCVHEIGHLLNLGHSDVVPEYDSAMCQVGNRLMKPRDCWSGARKEIERVVASGQSAFFDPPATDLNCLPLSFAARARLNTLPLDRLLPWGSIFERKYDGMNDCSCVRNSTRVR